MPWPVVTRQLSRLPCFLPLFCDPSNRSAALLKLNKLAKALSDAEECVKLDPTWDKGWMRKGMVLESQGQLQQVGPACNAACPLWTVNPSCGLLKLATAGIVTVLHASVL
jgi:stress-induced-phosphoprotein 1